MTSGLCLASSLGTVFGIERFRPLEKRHAILAVLSLTTAFGTAPDSSRTTPETMSDDSLSAEADESTAAAQKARVTSPARR